MGSSSVNRAGIALRPVTLPQHVYERMVRVLQECRMLVPVETCDRVNAALRFADQLGTFPPEEKGMKQ